MILLPTTVNQGRCIQQMAPHSGLPSGDLDSSGTSIVLKLSLGTILRRLRFPRAAAT